MKKTTIIIALFILMTTSVMGFLDYQQNEYYLNDFETDCLGFSGYNSCDDGKMTGGQAELDILNYMNVENITTRDFYFNFTMYSDIGQGTNNDARFFFLCSSEYFCMGIFINNEVNEINLGSDNDGFSTLCDFNFTEQEYEISGVLTGGSPNLTISIDGVQVCSGSATYTPETIDRVVIGMLDSGENQYVTKAFFGFTNEPTIPCFEDWVASYTTCTIGDNQTLTYSDANTCGTIVELPIGNNTIVSCNYCTSTYEETSLECVAGDSIRDITYEYTNTCCVDTGLETDCNIPSNTTESCIGIHSAQDIPNLFIDFIVTIGIFFISMVSIIGIGFGISYIVRMFR